MHLGRFVSFRLGWEDIIQLFFFSSNIFSKPGVIIAYYHDMFDHIIDVFDDGDDLFSHFICQERFLYSIYSL
jgi:hypothetical protein